MKISYSAIRQSVKVLALIMILIISFFRPVLKYFEYVHDGIRINISAVLIIFLFVSLLIIGIYIIHKNKIKINAGIVFALLILLFINLLQSIQLPFLLQNYNKNDIIVTLPEVVFHPWIFLFIGFYIYKIITNKQYDRLITILWVIYSTVILFYSVTNTSFKILTNGKKIYLMLADSYALLSFLFIVKLNKRKIIYIIISSILLFALLSRASFYLFIFSFVLYYIVNYSKKTFFIVILSAAVLGFFFTDITKNISQRKLQENRMLRLLTKNEDLSRIHRKEMFDKGVESIKRNIFFGEFMGDIRENNKGGNYIHNILSYWRQYGFFVFFGIVILIIINYFTVLKLVMNNEKQSKYIEFIFLYSTFFIAEIFTARSYLSAYIWLIFSAVPVYFLYIQNNNLIISKKNNE